MKIVHWLKCKYFGIHHGPVIDKKRVRIMEKKNKPPVILPSMPIRACLVCGESFGSYQDLMIGQ
jgi:hypothetical protein